MNVIKLLKRNKKNILKISLIACLLSLLYYKRATLHLGLDKTRGAIFSKFTTVTTNIKAYCHNKAYNTLKYINHKTTNALYKLDTKNINESIQDEIKKFKIENSILITENASLKKALRYIGNSEYKFVSARIIAPSSKLNEQSFLIESPQKQSLEIGNMVVNEFGAIGRITSIGDKFAKISLIGSKDIRIPVTLVKSNQNAIVTSTGEPFSELLQLQYIEDKNAISPEDDVVTMKSDDHTPYGIPVGKIIIIDKTPMVKPIANVNRLDTVFILMKKS